MSHLQRDGKIQLNAAHQFLDPFQAQGNRDTTAHCVAVNGGDLLRSRLLLRNIIALLVPANPTSQEAGERKGRYF